MDVIATCLRIVQTLLLNLIESKMELDISAEFLSEFSQCAEIELILPVPESKSRVFNVQGQ